MSNTEVQSIKTTDGGGNPPQSDERLPSAVSVAIEQFHRSREEQGEYERRMMQAQQEYFGGKGE